MTRSASTTKTTKSTLPVTIDVTQETQETQSHNETQDSQRDTSPVPLPTVAAGDGLSEEEQAIDVVRRQRAERTERFARAAEKTWHDYVVEAYYFWRDRDGEEYEWRTELFRFVWMLRGHPSVKEYLQNPGKALKLTEAVLKAWTARRSKQGKEPPYGWTNDDWFNWFAIDAPDARAEFADVWMKARYLPGQSPLQQAFDEARRIRLIIPDNSRDLRAVAPSSERCENDYEFFISLAGHLQVAVGENAIKLPCALISEMLGVSKMTISRYRQWAITDDFITETKAFKFRSKGKSDATEFRFNVGRYDLLEKKAAG